MTTGNASPAAAVSSAGSAPLPWPREAKREAGSVDLPPLVAGARGRWTTAVSSYAAYPMLRTSGSPPPTVTRPGSTRTRMVTRLVSSAPNGPELLAAPRPLLRSSCPCSSASISRACAHFSRQALLPMLRCPGLAGFSLRSPDHDERIRKKNLLLLLLLHDEEDQVIRVIRENPAGAVVVRAWPGHRNIGRGACRSALGCRGMEL